MPHINIDTDSLATMYYSSPDKIILNDQIFAHLVFSEMKPLTTWARIVLGINQGFSQTILKFQTNFEPKNWVKV